ncbi:retrotransposon protein, putative, ty1-copia subclass [Tanacetum coccineum]|uniref:Retrotransposon protein, putative, ty1-copia subclass n=1 Tax=Tanacetum coccineum TaxID=301880 RepID=A0ABQ5A3L1_9ASTR
MACLEGESNFVSTCRSMMNLTTLPLSFWDYALESATCILNMVPTKKVDRTPYELWYGKVPNLSYLKVWGCEALVKRDTPDKLQQRSIKCSRIVRGTEGTVHVRPSTVHSYTRYCSGGGWTNQMVTLACVSPRGKLLREDTILLVTTSTTSLPFRSKKTIIIHTFISHTQSLKIHFRNSDKSKNFLKSSSYWSRQKFYMRKIVSCQENPTLEGWFPVRHVKVSDAFNMGCNGDQKSLYSIPQTFDVPSLHRIDVDGDDGINAAPNVEDEDDENS